MTAPLAEMGSSDMCRVKIWFLTEHLLVFYSTWFIKYIKSGAQLMAVVVQRILSLSLSLWPEMLSCDRVQDTAATQTLIWSAASERISPETFSYFFPKNQIYFPVDQLEAMLVSSSHASLKSKTMKRVHLNATILSNWKHPMKRKNCELHFSGSSEAIAINYSLENGIPAAAGSSPENSILKRTRQLNPIIIQSFLIIIAIPPEHYDRSINCTTSTTVTLS